MMQDIILHLRDLPADPILLFAQTGFKLTDSIVHDIQDIADLPAPVDPFHLSGKRLLAKLRKLLIDFFYNTRENKLYVHLGEFLFMPVLFLQLPEILPQTHCVFIADIPGYLIRQLRVRLCHRRCRIVRLAIDRHMLRRLIELSAHQVFQLPEFRREILPSLHFAADGKITFAVILPAKELIQALRHFRIVCIFLRK